MLPMHVTSEIKKLSWPMPFWQVRRTTQLTPSLAIGRKSNCRAIDGRFGFALVDEATLGVTDCFCHQNAKVNAVRNHVQRSSLCLRQAPSMLLGGANAMTDPLNEARLQALNSRHCTIAHVESSSRCAINLTNEEL
jgi:hypothetical protein